MISWYIKWQSVLIWQNLTTKNYVIRAFSSFLNGAFVNQHLIVLIFLLWLPNKFKHCDHIFLLNVYFRTSAITLCKIVELLKVVELTFARHSLSILSFVNHICQHISFNTIGIIEKARVSFIKNFRLHFNYSEDLNTKLDRYLNGENQSGWPMVWCYVCYSSMTYNL